MNSPGCTCKVEHWQWHDPSCPVSVAQKKRESGVDSQPTAFPSNQMNSALDLAILFHDTYERLAPQFGYETRPATRKFSPSSPNGQLMRAVCEELLKAMRSSGETTTELERLRQLEEHVERVACWVDSNDVYREVRQMRDDIYNAREARRRAVKTSCSGDPA